MLLALKVLIHAQCLFFSDKLIRFIRLSKYMGHHLLVVGVIMQGVYPVPTGTEINLKKEYKNC